MEALDNPVWRALTGPQAAFSEGNSLALRYRTDVAAFAALPDEVGPDAWDALAQLVGPGGAALLFRPSAVALPNGWEVTMRLSALQMVATAAIGEPDDALVELGPADVADMLALVKRTRPGPFMQRTVELGTYLGVHSESGDRLVAMAGERVHPTGYTELSAVCTDADARKRGLATRLIRAVAAGIEARDETPMLHVSADNHSAIHVYEALGFTARAAFEGLVVRARR